MKEALECHLRRPLENAHLGGFSVRLAKHRAGAFIQQRHFGPSALDSFEASLVWAGKNRSENGGGLRGAANIPSSPLIERVLYF